MQPLVKAVSKTLGKPVSLLLSPWSPPAFLKETGVRNGGGHLKKKAIRITQIILQNTSPSTKTRPADFLDDGTE